MSMHMVRLQIPPLFLPCSAFVYMYSIAFNFSRCNSSTTARSGTKTTSASTAPRRSGFEWTPLLMDLILGVSQAYLWPLSQVHRLRLLWVVILSPWCSSSPTLLRLGSQWRDMHLSYWRFFGYPPTNVCSFLLLRPKLTSKLLWLSQYLVVVTFVYFVYFVASWPRRRRCGIPRGPGRRGSRGEGRGWAPGPCWWLLCTKLV